MNNSVSIPQYIEDMLEDLACDTTVLSEALLTIAERSIDGSLFGIDTAFDPSDSSKH